MEFNKIHAELQEQENVFPVGCVRCFYLFCSSALSGDGGGDADGGGGGGGEEAAEAPSWSMAARRMSERVVAGNEGKSGLFSLWQIYPSLIALSFWG